MKISNDTSKKAKKEENDKRRVTWDDYGNQSPVTKVIPDKKKESRKNACREKTDDNLL